MNTIARSWIVVPLVFLCLAGTLELGGCGQGQSSGTTRGAAEDGSGPQPSLDLSPQPTPSDAQTDSASSTGEDAASETVPTSPPTSPPTSSSEPSPVQAISANPDQAIVQIYTVDNKCQDFVAKAVAVPRGNSLEAAVGKVIDDRDTADFQVAGYQVEWDGKSQEVTIDLRLDPNSPRTFESLSSCEQKALFGSLRQTLTQNPDWQIHEVKFTHEGQDMTL